MLLDAHVCTNTHTLTERDSSADHSGGGLENVGEEGGVGLYEELRHMWRKGEVMEGGDEVSRCDEEEGGGMYQSLSDNPSGLSPKRLGMHLSIYLYLFIVIYVYLCVLVHIYRCI